jgi:hypothetical protein
MVAANSFHIDGSKPATRQREDAMEAPAGVRWPYRGVSRCLIHSRVSSY